MSPLPSGFRPCPIIGLDLNGARASAAQRRGRRGGTTPPRTLSVRRPDPDAAPDAAEFRRFGDVLARRGFHGRRLAMAVPGPSLLLETIELPPPESGAPIHELARTELASMHRLDPGGLTAAAIPLPPTRTGEPGRTLAVGCRIDDIERLLEATREGGLQIDHLTAGGLAAVAGHASGARGAGRASAETSAETLDLLLVAGWRWSELVVRRGGQLVSMRVLSDLGLRVIADGLSRIGADPMETQATLLCGHGDGDGSDPELIGVRDELILGHADRLAVEARRSLAYIEQEYGPPGGLICAIVGEGAACPGLSAAFVGALGGDRGSTDDSSPGDAVMRVARCLAVDAEVTERGVAA